MLRLEIGRSRTLVLLFSMVHGLAMLLLPWSGFPGWVNLLLGAGIALHALHAITLDGWPLRQSAIGGIELTDACELRVRDIAGQWQKAAIHPSSFVTPYLTVLNFRIEGQRRLRHLIIVPDRVDADAFRHLRVWLRWRCGGAGLEEKTVA